MSKYRFGDRSLARLSTCTPELRLIARTAIEITPVDFTIVWGFRNMHEQNELFAQGMTKKRWPESEHNWRDGDVPASRALDFGPWINGTIPWNDTHTFAVVAGVFFAAANRLGYAIRWGGDWDMDGLTVDQTFMDWGHIELAR